MKKIIEEACIVFYTSTPLFYLSSSVFAFATLDDVDYIKLIINSSILL